MSCLDIFNHRSPSEAQIRRFHNIIDKDNNPVSTNITPSQPNHQSHKELPSSNYQEEHIHTPSFRWEKFRRSSSDSIPVRLDYSCSW